MITQQRIRKNKDNYGLNAILVAIATTVALQYQRCRLIWFKVFCYTNDMKVVKHISIAELSAMADKMYGNLVKVDVDVAKNILIVDMGMHADGEAYLMGKGSKQEDLWGINLHPKDYGA